MVFPDRPGVLRLVLFLPCTDSGLAESHPGAGTSIARVEKMGELEIAGVLGMLLLTFVGFACLIAALY
jgi:hypothetical protein